MTSPFHEPKHRHVLVLLDPTHIVGESALHYTNGIIEPGDRVTLAVWPHGPSAQAIADFAHDDERSVAEIADVYLDQAAQRVTAGVDEIQAVALRPDDLALGLLGHIARSDVTEVVVPATIAGSIPGVEARVALESGVPVTIANGQLRRRVA